MARWGFTVDLERCVGCMGCVIACKAENGTPPSIHWMKVVEKEEGEYPYAKRIFTPLRCNHCADAPCARSCPTGAIVKRPDGIVDRVVCKLSGTEPSNWCKGGEYTEIFAADQLPLPPGQDLIRRMRIDLWTGLQASDACTGPSEEELVLNVNDEWARKWLGTGDGREWLDSQGLPRDPYFAPERECRAGDPQPVIALDLHDGQLITQPVIEIRGSAYAEEGFRRWRLDYGFGGSPDSWIGLAERSDPIQSGTLHIWNLSEVPNGPVTLRMTLVDIAWGGVLCAVVTYVAVLVDRWS